MELTDLSEVEKVCGTSNRLDVQTSGRRYWTRAWVCRRSIVRDEIRRRAIEPEVVEALDLARALPETASLPRWTTYRGNSPEARSWLKLGYRLVLPVYDAFGSLRSVRGWRARPSAHAGTGRAFAGARSRP